MVSRKASQTEGPLVLPERREPVLVTQTAMQRIDGTIAMDMPERIGADEQIAPKRRWDFLDDGQVVREELQRALQPVIDLGAPGVAEAISELVWGRRTFGRNSEDGAPLWVIIHHPDAPLRELGNAISEALFGHADGLIIADCSLAENGDDHLFGAPRGYAGCLEGGVIANHVRMRPESVVVLKNFEFADGDTLSKMHGAARNGDVRFWGTRGADYSVFPVRDAVFVLATTRTFFETGNDSRGTFLKWLKDARPDYKHWYGHAITIEAKVLVWNGRGEVR